MADVIETDYSTNPPTITEREYTETEAAQIAADQAAAIKAEKDRVAVEAAKVAARESAMLKLVALGLSVSEVEAIVGSV
jgi:hypothetical protein